MLINEARIINDHKARMELRKELSGVINRLMEPENPMQVADIIAELEIARGKVQGFLACETYAQAMRDREQEKKGLN